jgi:hypothetical protein
LIVLQRQAKRPALTTRDRELLVLLARRFRLWREALDRQARHPARLASSGHPCVLASQVQSQNTTTSCPRISDRSHPHHGTRQSLVGRKTHSRRVMEIRLSPHEMYL